MLVTKENIKRGMILVDMYGYSMTLYDFYQVVKIKGASVELIPLKTRTGNMHGFMQWQVIPIKACGYMQKDVIKKRFNKYNNISFNSSLSIYDDNHEYIEDHED